MKEEQGNVEDARQRQKSKRSAFVANLYKDADDVDNLKVTGDLAESDEEAIRNQAEEDSKKKKRDAKKDGKTNAISEGL